MPNQKLPYKTKPTPDNNTKQYSAESNQTKQNSAESTQTNKRPNKTKQKVPNKT